MNVKQSVAAMTFLGVLAGCDTGSPGDRIVAQAGTHEFTVQDVVDLLAGADFPNEAEVIGALANFWVDYTLIAIAAQEDADLENVDLEPVLLPQFRREVIQLYREASVQADTAIDDASLRALWEESPVDGRIRARHILLTLPDKATEEQRDSVFSAMNELKRRVEDGQSFSDMAIEFSQDPGTKSQGGDLGWFERGQMVRPFEDAAFALRPGEISDIVQTPFGLHLIRVDERETPDFESERDAFRAQVIAQRIRSADSVFLAAAVAGAELTVQDGALAVLRELGNAPWQPLNRRARKRALVEYTGGRVTAGEMQQFIQTRAPEFAGQVQQASDGPLENLLLTLARERLVVEKATESGIEIDQARRDSLTEMTRDQLVQAADQLGIRQITPVEGESPGAALDRTVRGIVQSVLDGSINVIPLGVVTSTLREQYDGRVLSTGIVDAIERLGEVRGVPGAPPLPVRTTTDSVAQGGDTTAAASDTAG
ncbi:MAG: hypothetical protein BMS9Abin29_0314 [Gemmatimonadota bacterium]|nr:MAG: hypothetical protein BMS9Abin29_0314 [Gemmatimonadota bacterium]